MQKTNQNILKQLYYPAKNSHKGQNGKLTIIGGSRLFHGASLWALKTASRIVDMVFYSTVKENQGLTKKLKGELYDFICIPKGKLPDYIKQSDAVLIGPGLVRGTKDYTGTGEKGEETKKITKKLLNKFPQKKWVIDAGSLQTIKAKWLKKLNKVIITPHKKEFLKLFESKNHSLKTPQSKLHTYHQTDSLVCDEKEKLTYFKSLIHQKAKEYTCTIVLKGKTDIICSPEKCLYNTTGNEGMTKGGTGDVLAGLIAALACKNNSFLAASAGAFLNGLAGDHLFKKVGPFYNASDLCDQLPKTMKKIFGY